MHWNLEEMFSNLSGIKQIAFSSNPNPVNPEKLRIFKQSLNVFPHSCICYTAHIDPQTIHYCSVIVSRCLDVIWIDNTQKSHLTCKRIRHCVEDRCEFTEECLDYCVCRAHSELDALTRCNWQFCDCKKLSVAPFSHPCVKSY